MISKAQAIRDARVREKAEVERCKKVELKTIDIEVNNHLKKYKEGDTVTILVYLYYCSEREVMFFLERRNKKTGGYRWNISIEALKTCTEGETKKYRLKFS